MVTSMAAEDYRARSGTEGLKTVLAQQGYYYGYGFTLGSQLTLRYQTLEAGVGTRWERFASIEGLDRFQERLTRDLHQGDARLRTMLWLGMRPLEGFADIGVGLEQTSRSGYLDDVRVSRGERRATMTLGFAL
jgi:hypothetical protein